MSASVSSGVNLGLKNRFGKGDESSSTVDEMLVGDVEADLQNAPSARLNPCYPLIPLFSSLEVERFNEIISNALQYVNRDASPPPETPGTAKKPTSPRAKELRKGAALNQAWPTVDANHT